MKSRRGNWNQKGALSHLSHKKRWQGRSVTKLAEVLNSLRFQVASPLFLSWKRLPLRQLWSSQRAWQFASSLHIASQHGWQKRRDKSGPWLWYWHPVGTQVALASPAPKSLPHLPGGFEGETPSCRNWLVNVNTATVAFIIGFDKFLTFTIFFLLILTLRLLHSDWIYRNVSPCLHDNCTSKSEEGQKLRYPFVSGPLFFHLH